MAIENVIQDNTNAVLKLCALVEQLVLSTQTALEAAAKQVEHTGKAETVTTKPAAAKDKTPEKSKAVDTGSETAARDLIRKINTEILDARGRDELAHLLSRYGCKKGGELKPEQFDDYIVQANKVLAGESAADADLV
jgi:hypothetical protein